MANLRFLPVLRPLYDRFLRPYLPRKLAVLNGVAVRQPRLLDLTDVRPGYEEPLLAAIRETVRPGDRVVIVGGGLGVSSVVAARQAGPTGYVITYEGSGDQARRVAETLQLNQVDERVDVRHAVVSEPVSLYGDPENAETVSPAQLPACDVLVLDCEGTEKLILSELQTSPDSIVVEVHPMYDVTRTEVRTLLAESGYQVLDEGREETPDGPVFVLMATRSNDV